VKIKVIQIGKTGKKFLIEGEDEYLKRLKHYVPIERIEIPDLKNSKNLSIDQQKKAEGELILQKINTGEQVYLLDEKGKEFSSEAFAEFLQQRFNQGGHALTLIIGGPYGFSEEMYQKANGKISLSKMTFSHQMIRMILLEQIYRGMTILKGEPYHHS
jgi:23S rRNA (pseudouridine1915-N3)-methyltransferase